ncbi:hypothetical protein [Agrobacterium tumefaciens]|uniref:hypothetical protein n=1 Tax=Agrobacterium tumefaciens TaxID=358 RepID=UPI001572EC41|nr:hypothetical protein [Agrobacterium tumefaciens]
MNALEMTWTQAGEGYTLSVVYPQEADEAERLQIAALIHDCGFVSLGGDQWTAPDDENAPLALNNALTNFGVATMTTLDTLPPALEAQLAAIPFI